MARSPSPTRREAILEAARSAFLREGFEAASIRRIAEGAGVPATAVYTYFADKDALFVAALAPVTAAVEQALAALESDLPTAIALGADLDRRLAAARAAIRFAHAHRASVLLLGFGAAGTSLAGWLDQTRDRVVALEGSGLRWLESHTPSRLRSAPSGWLVRAVVSMEIRTALDWLREELPLEELERRAEELVRYLVQANERHLAGETPR